MQTTVSALPVPVSPSTARRVLEEALRMYADAPGTSPADADLALAMASNPVGWTHTTRLRDFLEKTAQR